MYVLGNAYLTTLLVVIRQVGIRQSTQIPSDLRAYAQALLTSLPHQLLIPYIHPTFYSLHNMGPDVRLQCAVVMTEESDAVPTGWYDWRAWCYLTSAFAPYFRAFGATWTIPY